MSDVDNGPSIGELQRLSHQWRELSLGCQCDALPGDAACGVHLPPVLLEIAATGIAWAAAEDALSAAQPGVARIVAAMRASEAFDKHRAALAKVRP